MCLACGADSISHDRRRSPPYTLSLANIGTNQSHLQPSDRFGAQMVGLGENVMAVDRSDKARDPTAEAEKSRGGLVV